jgi:predicted double-glycine peptidase
MASVLARLALALQLGVLLSLGALSVKAAELQTMTEGGGPYHIQVVSYHDLPFRSVVRQHYDFSCGSAALATLLRFHYGIPLSEADVFKAMYAVGDKKLIQRVGFSLLDMKRYLATRNLVADGYRTPLETLARANTPAIVVISVGRYKHFVVVKGLRGGLVLVGDPALGIKAYPIAAFLKIWDGAVFVIHGPSGRAATFNAANEWAMAPNAPLSWAVYQQQSISELTRDVPIVFQITPTIQLPVMTSGAR